MEEDGTGFELFFIKNNSFEQSMCSLLDKAAFF